MVGPLIALGTGVGLAVPHMMNIALSVVPASRSGRATGVVNTAFPLGTATGVAIFGAVLTSRINTLDWIPEPIRTAGATGQLSAIHSTAPTQTLVAVTKAFSEGLSTMLLIAAVSTAVCGAMCWFAIQLPRPQHEPPADNCS